MGRHKVIKPRKDIFLSTSLCISSECEGEIEIEIEISGTRVPWKVHGGSVYGRLKQSRFVPSGRNLSLSLFAN